MTTKLSVRECLSFGWNTFKVRPWFFIGVVLIVGIIQLVLGSLQNETMGVLGFVLSFVISTFVYCGILKLFLTAHDDVHKASFNDLWNPVPFLRYLGVSVLLAIILGIGFVLLIIPGIILMLVFFFSGYLVIDTNIGPVASLKESARLTKGNRWKLFLLVLAMTLLFILGMIPVFLGLLVTAPVIAIAGIHAYRTLSKETGSSAPVAIS